MSEVFREAARYASDLHWPVVRNYGMANGVCMCHLGEKCATPGKHPVESNWLQYATKDEEVIASWFEGDKPWNIGLPLGPASGVVDTEWDDDDSLATAKKFGLVDAKTLGYTSNRGGHRLWLLDERLITVPKAVKKIGGMEVRFGGGGKQTQSILPPSLHHSGVTYSWDAGRSPDDIEIARMPEALVLAVIASEGGEVVDDNAITKNTVYERIVQNGERHTAMVSWISSEIMRMRDPHDPAEQQHVLLVMRSLNRTQLASPLSSSELESIWRSQLRWGMKARACGATKVASTDPDADQKVEEAKKSNVHTLSGLELRGDEWFPGMWRLTVVHSDPKEFRLGVPIVGGDDEERVLVSLSSAEWSSPISVARKILEATGTIDVTDPNPQEWAKIWNGYSAKKSGEKGLVRVRGLKVKLMDEKTEEWPPAEQHRFAQVAGWLLDALSNTAPPDPDSDETSPHPSGKPCWVRSPSGEYELYFSWTRVFEDISKTRKVSMSDGDRLSLKRRILAAAGEKEFEARRVKTDAGVKRRYIVWKQSHITHLEDIAHPQDSRP